MAPNKLSLSQINTVNGLATFFSVLSVLGSTFILFCYFKFKHLRKFAFTLVAWLSLADVLNQVADFVQPSTENIMLMEAKTIPVTNACYVQAVGDSIFELSSVLWSSAISVTVHLSVFKRLTPKDLQARFWMYHAVCFGLPLLLLIGPAVDHAFGPAGGWCWIVESPWRWVCFYVPLWICIVFNSVVYIRVLLLLRQTIRTAGPNDTTAANIRAIHQRLKFYPFILLCVWTFPTINRIYEAGTGGDQNMGLYVLQKCFSSSQGFFNAFAYGFSVGVREAIRDLAAAWCPRYFGVKDSLAAAAGGVMVPSSSGGGGGGSVPDWAKPAPLPSSAAVPEDDGIASASSQRSILPGGPSDVQNADYSTIPIPAPRPLPAARAVIDDYGAGEDIDTAVVLPGSHGGGAGIIGSPGRVARPAGGHVTQNPLNGAR